MFTRTRAWRSQLTSPALPRGNLLADLPAALPHELTSILAGNAHVRIERIVSTGQRSAEGFWYEQDEHEWVVVLQGAAKLSIQGCEAPLDLAAGDHILLPAHTRHRVEWTTANGPTVWLAVFFADAPAS